MRLPRLMPRHEEPIGIVIADGGRADLTPRFTAFVWGPVPDDEPELLPLRRETIEPAFAGL